MICVLTGPLREMGRRMGEMDSSSHCRDGNPETEQGGGLVADAEVKR